jgi:hypothetical protein
VSLAEALGVGTMAVLIAALFAYGIQARELVRQTQVLNRTNEMAGRQTEELIRQTDLLNVTNRATVSQNINAMMHEISRILLDLPQLRSCFYEGQPIPTDEHDRLRVLVLAEMFLDFMSMTLNHEALLSAEEAAGWHSYFRDLARASPAICERWQSTRDWYEPPMWELIDDVVRDARATRPEEK